ncbi:hypothetical protein [Pontibacillus marinus]|uniref:Uncharacterized protein n=1 Tax=Pontibacillus marinus BH030004 = DSM 16465 TaxID=1385511 RepID=A0A0A5GBV4_9BACI|nr:hypothetical protein [Pontibacillus marinus]KGX90666.1 hypothetical protein N783_20110 [Pontibacillus marinus BH030004 = DSM 16465]
MKKQVFKRLYEGIMILLVMMTIMTLWTESAYNSAINWVVWFIFFVDFIIRFTFSNNKWEFIKKNPFLVIAVIPLDQFFQMARIVRLIYLFRIKTITKYYIQPFVQKLTYQSKVWIFTILLLFLLAQSFLVWRLEENVLSFWDATYAVFGHLIFFGHRMVDIQEGISLWMFVITSIIGVLLHGLALQWAFTKIETIIENRKHNSAKS